MKWKELRKEEPYKDFLVAWRGEPDVTVGFWSELFQQWCDPSGGAMPFNPQPTHYGPLPEPPEGISDRPTALARAEE